MPFSFAFYTALHLNFLLSPSRIPFSLSCFYRSRRQCLFFTRPLSLFPAPFLRGELSPFQNQNRTERKRQRERRTHLGQRRQAEKNRQRSAMLAGRQAKGNNITALCGEAEKCICVNASPPRLPCFRYMGGVCCHNGMEDIAEPITNVHFLLSSSRISRIKS